MDGDADLEPEVTEQDDEPELDDVGEDDDEDCSGDEGEPDFRKRRRYRRNEAGPGCSISDQDYGGEEIGDREEGTTPTYGHNQVLGPLPPHAH